MSSGRISSSTVNFFFFFFSFFTLPILKDFDLNIAFLTDTDYRITLFLIIINPLTVKIINPLIVKIPSSGRAFEEHYFPVL